MPLRVKPMVQYLTEQVEKMRDQDYTALSVAKAVKGREPGGRNKTLLFKKQPFSFGPGNPAGAVALWTAWAADIVRSSLDRPDEPVVIVPVPNSQATTEDRADFRTWELARLIAESVGGNVMALDELRWTEVMPKASEGGPRHAYQLYPKLACALQYDPAADRILIDDVLTSGGHMQAAAARLTRAGTNVVAGLACGRTMHVQVTNPFGMPVEELSDFDPDDPFGFGAFFDEAD